MRKRIAVMDLGTNTFHLLIAEGPLSDFCEIVHDHAAVKLGEGGINSGIIKQEAFDRGIDTMQQFHQHILKHHVEEVKAIATSALRNAANGNDFINKVKAETGIEIEVIDGDAEAIYIYNGVKACGCLTDDISLIMDIGGGSVEFILGTVQDIIWKQSFEIGAARLMDLFHRTDPIPPASVEALNYYLEENLADLFEAAKNVPINKLIGSSGAFETFAEVIELKKGKKFDLKKVRSYQFDQIDLLAITDLFVHSSHHERTGMEGVIPVRVDMIVVASLITRYIMQRLNIAQVEMCTYSLKEGVLAKMME